MIFFTRFVLEGSAHLRTHVVLWFLLSSITSVVLKHVLFLSQNKTEWPWRGGANGSVRFYPEISHAANAGMSSSQLALKCLLDAFWICIQANPISGGRFQPGSLETPMITPLILWLRSPRKGSAVPAYMEHGWD